jgi:hypothetical protein
MFMEVPHRVGAWSGARNAVGSKSINQSSAGTFTYTLTCKNAVGTGSASATLTELSVPGSTVTVEGMTGLPVDIKPLLSIVGIWQPVAEKYLTSQFNGTLSTVAVDNIVLPGGREGLVTTGFPKYPGTESLIPIDISILQQETDGTLREATSAYISDPQVNGGTSVVVADFNKDGVEDIYLAPYNESPTKPTNSVVHLSNPGGTYHRVTIDDLLNAQDAELADIDGTPTVFTGSYYVAAGHADTVSQYNGDGGFPENPEPAQGETRRSPSPTFMEMGPTPRSTGTSSTVRTIPTPRPKYSESTSTIFRMKIPVLHRARC